MSEPRHPQVVNADAVPSIDLSYGQRFHLTRKQLGMAAGARKLGCTLVEFPPGKRSWPLHYHAANEEAIYVLEGQDGANCHRSRTTRDQSLTTPETAVPGSMQFSS